MPVELVYEPESGSAKEFSEVAVLPESGDNCAIARTPLPAGTTFKLPSGQIVRLAHTILEGHRFAVSNIASGEHVKSWKLTFGIALRDIVPGEYMANDRVLKALRARGMTELPEQACFQDIIVPHKIDEAAFVPAEQVSERPEHEKSTWLGYHRPAPRTIGTRNFIILVGATSLSSGYVKALEARVKELALASGLPQIDGVVAVAHTEGGGSRSGPRPQNFELLCRTLSAFIVHPNVAAALIVDYGSQDESLWNDDLQEYANSHPIEVPLSSVPHKFLRLSGDLESDLSAGVAVVESWIPQAAACVRAPAPLTALSIAQQCGGSDAFSGVSGNPCAGEACMLLIKEGGQAVLAETDELMGAESYVLEKVKDLSTAKRFLTIVEGFKERLAWHGQSAESNPSGGNNYRGLYNIGLKSLGAAKKKHAEVRLDGVLDYGQSTRDLGRGYFMMDSPGNDLESIAGQVATGCNLIYFITGNGSITNFPFVPTIKIVTTSARFELLKKDMDFNAGRYQEGTPMPVLGKELFDLTIKACNGEKTVGERAGHAQVSLWRNWAQSGPTDVTKFNHASLRGKSIAVKTTESAPSLGPVSFNGYSVSSPGAASSAQTQKPYVATERIGLILPTSLCSGEVARQITTRLNSLIQSAETSTEGAQLARCVSRFDCLPHTEGCGTGYAEGGMALYERVMLGHLTHPSIGMALCLEHGCEKTHNDFFHNSMAAAGISSSAYGYASIQLDGGIEAVTKRVVAYFAEKAKANGAEAVAVRAPLPISSLDVALLVTDPSAASTPEVALTAALLARCLSSGGGSLVLPSNSPLLRNRVFVDELGLQADLDSEEPLEPTLAFAQRVRPLVAAEAAPEALEAVKTAGGVHVMDMPFVRDWNDTTTGLAATGCHAIISLSISPKKSSARTTPGHPFVPVLSLGCALPDDKVDVHWAASTDAILSSSNDSASTTTRAIAESFLSQALAVIAQVAEGTKKPKSSRNVFFSIARGQTGVST